MKTIELIGGMSWESSAAYYRPINPRRTARLGGHRNARSIMATVCRDEIETRRHAGRRDEPGRLGRLGQRAARQAEAGGVDFILLCTHDVQSRAHDRGRAVRAVRAHRRSARARAGAHGGLRAAVRDDRPRRPRWFRRASDRLRRR
ncbi:aspartate racemase [Burkholderia pseudomallei]|uniref:aspartate racemase n=1 Tax=Burkholderia pseudomallei TaxID=28450 RepID=UPI000AFC71EF|nr:aspartate racemase [Burkholderia pseudomallei]